MKRRIRQNIWGNWNGYEGKRKVREFGTDEATAKEWLVGIEPERGWQPGETIKFGGRYEAAQAGTEAK